MAGEKRRIVGGENAFYTYRDLQKMGMVNRAFLETICWKSDANGYWDSNIPFRLMG